MSNTSYEIQFFENLSNDLLKKNKDYQTSDDKLCLLKEILCHQQLKVEISEQEYFNKLKNILLDIYWNIYDTKKDPVNTNRAVVNYNEKMLHLVELFWYVKKQDEAFYKILTEAQNGTLTDAQLLIDYIKTRNDEVSKLYYASIVFFYSVPILLTLCLFIGPDKLLLTAPLLSAIIIDPCFLIAIVTHVLLNQDLKKEKNHLNQLQDYFKQNDFLFSNTARL